MPRAKSQQCEIESDGRNIFVVIDGVKIAKRGPAKTWISLEPGWQVLDSESSITVEYKAPGRRS